MCRDERAVWARCVVRGAPKRIWRARRGRVERVERKRERIAVCFLYISSISLYTDGKHTNAFPVKSPDCSIPFFEPNLPFFTIFELDPTTGRQRIAYNTCIVATVAMDCRSSDTGSATRAGKRM